MQTMVNYQTITLLYHILIDHVLINLNINYKLHYCLKLKNDVNCLH